MTARLCRNRNSQRVHIRMTPHAGKYICEEAVRHPVWINLDAMEELSLCSGCGAEALFEGILVFADE